MAGIFLSYKLGNRHKFIALRYKIRQKNFQRVKGVRAVTGEIVKKNNTSVADVFLYV